MSRKKKRTLGTRAHQVAPPQIRLAHTSPFAVVEAVQTHTPVETAENG